MCGSGLVPSHAWLAPRMSLLNMPCRSAPAAFLCAAVYAGAVQPLLVPGDGGEHERARELAGGEQPGQLEHDRHAGGVVIGTGVARRAEHAPRPRIQRGQLRLSLP
jgi:hypothetical protein